MLLTSPMIHGVVSFPGKHDDEKILEVIRKHCITHWIGLIRFFVMAIFPTLMGFIVFLALKDQMRPKTFLALCSFLCLFCAFFTEISLVRWLNEELNLIIITNLRAVDVTQHGFLRRTIAETNLDQIQDISGETGGICGNLLNYGDLSIRTASTYRDFFMTRVPNPHLKAREILDFVDEYHRKNETPK